MATSISMINLCSGHYSLQTQTIWKFRSIKIMATIHARRESGYFIAYLSDLNSTSPMHPPPTQPTIK